MIANYVKAGLICLCALGISNNSVAQTPDTPIKNIVLVHGAWADGSGWKGVYDILVKDGFKVSIVQEPDTSFQDDVNAVKRILTLQDGPSIIVAHSYGGAVITEAGNDPSVVGFGVYRGPHAGFRRERVRRRKALSERPRQIGRHKENARRFHIY